jgi:hypothetical protein
LTAVAACACVGVLGTSTTAAFAAATVIPAQELPFRLTLSPLPSAGQPGVRVSGTCPSWLFTDNPTFVYSSGSAVLYGPASNSLTFGFNIIGTATVTWNAPDGTVDGIYVGHAHIWFNQNTNPTNNGQQYSGFTNSFQGTSVTAGTLTITSSGGQTTAANAAGNTSGWGHFNVSCG